VEAGTWPNPKGDGLAAAGNADPTLAKEENPPVEGAEPNGFCCDVLPNVLEVAPNVEFAAGDPNTVPELLLNPVEPNAGAPKEEVPNAGWDVAEAPNELLPNAGCCCCVPLPKVAVAPKEGVVPKALLAGCDPKVEEDDPKLPFVEGEFPKPVDPKEGVDKKPGDCGFGFGFDEGRDPPNGFFGGPLLAEPPNPKPPILNPVELEGEFGGNGDECPCCGVCDPNNPPVDG